MAMLILTNTKKNECNVYALSVILNVYALSVICNEYAISDSVEVESHVQTSIVSHCYFHFPTWRMQPKHSQHHF